MKTHRPVRWVTEKTKLDRNKVNYLILAKQIDFIQCYDLYQVPQEMREICDKENIKMISLDDWNNKTEHKIDLTTV